jgi:hypothetical protein
LNDRFFQDVLCRRGTLYFVEGHLGVSSQARSVGEWPYHRVGFMGGDKVVVFSNIGSTPYCLAPSL